MPQALDDLAVYYNHLGADEFDRAFALRSARSRRETPKDYFTSQWSNNRDVYLEWANLLQENGRRAKVHARIVATDWDGREAVPKPYEGVVDMVFEGGRWRYDGGDLKLLPARGK